MCLLLVDNGGDANYRRRSAAVLHFGSFQDGHFYHRRRRYMLHCVVLRVLWSVQRKPLHAQYRMFTHQSLT